MLLLKQNNGSKKQVKLKLTGNKKKEHNTLSDKFFEKQQSVKTVKIKIEKYISEQN